MGHGGLWAIDIDEGVTVDDFGGRRWEVTVAPAMDAIAAGQAERHRGRQQQAEQDRADEDAVMRALDLRDPTGQGASLEAVRTESRLSRDRLSRAISRLTRQGIVIGTPGTLAGDADCSFQGRIGDG